MHGLTIDRLETTRLGWSCWASVGAADAPIFDGHFPWQPVVPGVAQLLLVTDIVRACIGDQSRVARLVNVRFRRTLAPGEEIEVQLTKPAPDGRAMFQIKRGRDDIASGALVIEAD